MTFYLKKKKKRPFWSTFKRNSGYFKFFFNKVFKKILKHGEYFKTCILIIYKKNLENCFSKTVLKNVTQNYHMRYFFFLLFKDGKSQDNYVGKCFY